MLPGCATTARPTHPGSELPGDIEPGVVRAARPGGAAFPNAVALAGAQTAGALEARDARAGEVVVPQVADGASGRLRRAQDGERGEARDERIPATCDAVRHGAQEPGHHRAIYGQLAGPRCAPGRSSAWSSCAAVR